MAPRPTAEEMADAVRTWIGIGSGIPRRRVIPANDGPVPQGPEPFVTVQTISRTPLGVPDAVVTIRHQFSVQWFREGAEAAADQFFIWSRTPWAKVRAQALGFSIVLVGALRDLDEYVAMTVEERAGLELDVGYVQVDDGTVNELGDFAEREPASQVIAGSAERGYALAVNVTAGGSGYTSAPTVTFSGGGGTGAAAEATLEPTALEYGVRFEF